MPSSERNAVIIADANVLLSAIANRAAIKVFDSNLDIYTTEFTCAEVAEYIPKFSKRYGIAIERMFQSLRKLPMDVKDFEFYEGSMKQAKKIMRDPDDVELAGLALELDAPVWSNDDHFKDFPTKRYTTAQLLKKIGY